MKVAEKICKYYKTYYDLPMSEVTLLCNLKGGMFFFSDLCKYIRQYQTRKPEVDDTYPKIDFVQTSSYGENTSSEATVSVLRSYKPQGKNEHVLLIDDIADTGKAIKTLSQDLIKHENIATLNTCVLVDKVERRTESIFIQFCCFSVPSGYLVGYGLGIGDKYRSLPDIYKIMEK